MRRTRGGGFRRVGPDVPARPARTDAQGARALPAGAWIPHTRRGAGLGATLRGGGRLQLADLDEAVLGCPDVIDLAPRLGSDARRDGLYILARPLGEGLRVDTAALERAVLRVPAVAAAAAGEVLGVRVAVAADDEGRPCSTGMLKRTFEDTRLPEEARARDRR